MYKDKDRECEIIKKRLYVFIQKTSEMKKEIKRREFFAECADTYLSNELLNLKQWNTARALFSYSDLGVEKIFREVQKNS